MNHIGILKSLNIILLLIYFIIFFKKILYLYVRKKK